MEIQHDIYLYLSLWSFPLSRARFIVPSPGRHRETTTLDRGKGNRGNTHYVIIYEKPIKTGEKHTLYIYRETRRILRGQHMSTHLLLKN